LTYRAIASCQVIEPDDAALPPIALSHGPGSQVEIVSGFACGYHYVSMSEAERLIAAGASDLYNARYAIALTGAGMSTESGIPDFRGPSGIWTRNPEEERLAYRSYERFLRDPKAWWRQSLTGSRPVLGNLWDAKPNRGHIAMANLEAAGFIKCVITQNIDALHERAGSKHVLEYHGSFMKLRCTSCGSRFYREQFDIEKLSQEDALPPRCPACKGILKSDTVSFGEPIPSDVAHESIDEAEKCDLMLICGTSAVVYPFANLPLVAKERSGVTIIEINAEPTPLTRDRISDYLIRGKTGVILPAIAEAVSKLAKNTE
jgi:NAD-dependent deacetylase